MKSTNSTLDKEQLGRLRESIEYSRGKQEYFRKNRYDAITQYVANHYSDVNTTERTPLNLLAMAVIVYTQNLAARRPRVLITTQYEDLLGDAKSLELALNVTAEKMELETVFQSAVMEALFSGLGCIKTGLALGGQVQVGDSLRDVGDPFVESVDFDDLILDMNARDFRNMEFCGNYYRMNLEELKNSGFITNTEIIGKLKKSEKSKINEEGDAKAEAIGTGSDGGADEFEDHVDLMDVYVSRHRLIITLARDQEELGALRSTQWTGPRHGPYRFLGFHPVPGNLMDMSPVSMLQDLHDLINVVYRKLARQAARQKTIVGVQAGSDEDGRRVVNANDGEAIRIDNPQATKEIRFGGVDNQTLGFGIHMRDAFSYMGGNIDALGGLAAQADTIGQEQMLGSGASVRMQDMAQKTLKFAAGVFSDLGFYLYTDPFVRIPIIKRIPALGFDIETEFSSANTKADYLLYNVNIEPYSMRFETPESRINALIQFISQFIVPLMPIMQTQGISLDFNVLMELFSRYRNLPELGQVIRTNIGMVPQPVPSAGPDHGSSLPRSTQRTYTRVNRNPDTQNKRDNKILSKVLGGSPSDQQQSA